MKIDSENIVRMQNSTPTGGAQLTENWTTLRHQSHPALVPGWTSGVADFASYMQ